MVKFTKDTIVQPIISEWFGFYKENSVNETLTLQESDLYKEVILASFPIIEPRKG